MLVNSKPVMPQTDTKVETLTEEQKIALEKAKQNLETKPVTFGDGRYSNAMKELFQDSQRLLQINATQAEKLARSFGAELGKQNVNAKITFGRYSTKNNQITLKESATYKGLVVTFSISMAKLCVLLQESIAFGFDHEKSKVELRSTWVEWLNK